MDAITREERLMDGQILEPITREERILAGEDLEVVTRREYFLKKYRGGGGDITVESLNVTENGTYTAPTGKAYSPVTVELPLSSKTITENGTYTASEDNLAGFNEVTVAVEGYAKKSIPNTPTAIATFNASALPMPSLTVGIEAVQAGNGDPSPTNVRPFTGWSAVKIVDMPIITKITYFQGLLDGTYGFIDLGSEIWNKESNFFRCNPNNMPMIDGTNSIISRDYVINNPYASENDDIYLVYNQNDVGHIIIRDLDYTDATAFKTAMNGAYVIYKLATPTTPTITDEQFNSLLTAFGINGEIYTTILKDGQGNPMTCYGGQLVNENGVQRLDNTHNSFDMGSVSWSYYNLRFFTKIDDIWINEQATVPTDNQLMCEIYKTVMYTNQPTGTVATWNGYIYVKDDSYNGDITAFRTAVTGYKIAYKKATPQQIPQDNLPISSQDGTNNLWADSGDIQSGEYMEAL